MAVAEALLTWYKQHHRALPWRATKDPYRIWLSEIILQQTRVAQGMPYYEKFVEHYPTVHSLAAADIDEVLRAWQGLGYYTRARNLHRCARVVCEIHAGKFPDSYAGLLKLPGIGKYTAAAIASFCFGQRVPVVDGNVIRLIARLYGIEDDVRQAKTVAQVERIAQRCIAHAPPGAFNQAIMEFGALQCTPKNPDCPTCPLQHVCVAFRSKRQHSLPYKSKSRQRKERFFHYVVLQQGQKLWMQKRPAGDIWAGLYEFCLVESDRPLEPDEALALALHSSDASHGQLREVSRTFKHMLTHQHIHAVFLKFVYNDLHANKMNQENSYYDASEIEKLPKPILIEKYLKGEII